MHPSITGVAANEYLTIDEMSEYTNTHANRYDRKGEVDHLNETRIRGKDFEMEQQLQQQLMDELDDDSDDDTDDDSDDDCTKVSTSPSQFSYLELFMEAQGYKPKITLAKDNESEIRMLVHGKALCTSNSKHVAIKYFWCTDRIKKGDISVRHCPTEKMIADYMSKPLQGKLFVTFRNVIM